MSNISMFQEAEKAKQIIIREGKIYATQKGMAMAFDVLIGSVSKVINSAKKDSEVDFSATFYQSENGSGVSGVKVIAYYPIEVIMTVGFRLRKEGVTAKFAGWASRHIESLITTGVAVDHAILSKQKNKQQIIDELWRKVSFTEAEINYMLSVVINEDDQAKSKEAMKHIYAAVTNKARVAATGMTAAQIKLARCCHTKENLGMTVSPELNPDKQTARNYLTSEELELSTAVEQTFTIILRSALRAGKKMGITQIIDLLDNSIVTLLFMDIKPKEAPAKGLADKAKAHVVEQGKLAELLLEGGNGVDQQTT